MLETILSQTEETLPPTIWESIKSFFNPTLDGYTNFEFSGGILNLQIIIFGLFGGVILASFYAIFIKTTLGKIVRVLLSSEALSPERAMTLAECSLSRHIFIRYALRHGTTLRRVVHCVEEDEFTKQTKEAYALYEKQKEEAKRNQTAKPKWIDPKFSEPLDKCHFYIPEKDRITAGMRYNEKGSGYPTFLFVLLGCFISILLTFAFLPQLVQFFDNVVSMFSVKGNTLN